MESINKGLILKEIPLFSDLSGRERRYIEKKFTLVEYKKGQIIYLEGSPPSYFYCVILGRVVVYTKDKKGGEKILEYLHRGKYFGIISLLTGETHSVTARAVNDCLLLAMAKDDFIAVLKKIPRLAIDLSQTLSRRLKRKDIHQKIIFETTIISVFSCIKNVNKFSYTADLSIGLKKETRKSVVILDISPMDEAHRLPQKLKPLGRKRVFNLSFSFRDITKIKKFISKTKDSVDVVFFHYAAEEKQHLRRLVNILGILVNDYHYIVLNLPVYQGPGIFDLLSQSNIIHIITTGRENHLKMTARLLDKLKGDLCFPEAKIRVVLDKYKLRMQDFEEEERKLRHHVFAVLPAARSKGEKKSNKNYRAASSLEYNKVIRRISRYEGDCLVGLALGVGVAYGLCHVGALKVFEEENVPIDVISGSSMGALIAALWAIGKSSKEILEITKEFKEPKYIWGLVDLTFPFLGFIKGNRLYNFLRKYLGGKTFRDTRIPLKIIACDVKRKEWKVLEKGLLLDAIMASCAMPGIFMPVKWREEMLFDGGVIKPLPTEPLFEMGIKRIIAINVTPSREDIIAQYERIKGSFVGPDKKKKKNISSGSRKHRSLFDIFNVKRYFHDRFKTNILDIIFSSFEVMQSEMVKKEAQLADIVLHPDVGGLHWLELHKAEEFVERGERETRKNLSRILKVINE